MPLLNKAFYSLNKDFQPIVQEILVRLESLEYQPTVAEGRRTEAQQREKVRLGYSQTMQSYHLSGLAADIIDKRWGWNIGNVHRFWWDLYLIASSLSVRKGKIRCGLIWDHPERADIYNRALNKDKSAKVNWFVDAAHIELRK